MAASVAASVVLGAAGGTVAAQDPAAGPEPLEPAALRDEDVRAAIDAVVEELYRRRDPERFWEPDYASPLQRGQAGGYTALAALALLYAGESYQDPRLRPAIESLASAEMTGTYAVAVRAHVWSMLPPRFEANLKRDLRWLLESFSRQAGGWNYGFEPTTTRRDNSITQYGTLALWEAAKRGLPVPAAIWASLEDRFLSMQLADGGWNYIGRGGSTGSMTAAGLMVLFITQDHLHAPERARVNPAEPAPHEVALAEGLAWMDRNFSPRENPGNPDHYHYYLYGVERVGLASGYKFFGGRDWFREGAAALINELCGRDPEAGGLRVHATRHGDPNGAAVETTDLCFALMFLSRGRVPVAVNKLRLTGHAWNNRPRDVANVVRWIGENVERALNWQIVDFAADPEAWLDAPLLYLASHEPPAWIVRHEPAAEAYLEAHRRHRAALARGEASTPPRLENAEELARLKRYLDSGGLLFANADTRDRRFAEAVELAGRLMYPAYEWRDLPADHPAYRLYEHVDARRVPLRGLSNGVRELILLSPRVDLGETFQTNATRREEHHRVFANVFLHASEKGRARPRLEAIDPASPREAPNEIVAPTHTIVHAIHGGGWNAEPLALEAFARRLEREGGLRVEVREHPLVRLDALNPPPDLVVVSGVDAGAIPEAERAAVESFVRRGGRVLFETTGGRGDFASVWEAVLAARLGTPPRALRHSALLRGDPAAGQRSLERIAYRPYSFELFGSYDTANRLRGFEVDGEWRVFLSRDDLLHGLLDRPAWGVSGPEPEFAHAILRRLLTASRATSPAEPDAAGSRAP